MWMGRGGQWGGTITRGPRQGATLTRQIEITRVALAVDYLRHPKILAEVTSTVHEAVKEETV